MLGNKFFSCCMDCKERVPGCHSTCERYLSDKAKYDEAKAKIKAEREYDIYFSDRINEIQTKKLKRKKKHQKFLTKRSVK